MEGGSRKEDEREEGEEEGKGKFRKQEYMVNLQLPITSKKLIDPRRKKKLNS